MEQTKYSLRNSDGTELGQYANTDAAMEALSGDPFEQIVEVDEDGNPTANNYGL